MHFSKIDAALSYLIRMFIQSILKCFGLLFDWLEMVLLPDNPLGHCSELLKIGLLTDQIGTVSVRAMIFDELTSVAACQNSCC